MTSAEGCKTSNDAIVLVASEDETQEGRLPDIRQNLIPAKN